MNFRTLLLGALAVLAGPLYAQTPPAQEVPNGSQWTGGGSDDTVTTNVSASATDGSATVSYTDGYGTSPDVAGIQGANSSQANPTASRADSASTQPNGGNRYRIREGKMQRKGADGIWRNMKKKEKRGTLPWSPYYLQAGDTAPRDGVLRAPGMADVPLQAGEVAPWAGLLGPGEEVTSLPD